MLAHLRFQSQAWATHHVVSRCIQGYGFLKPSYVIKSICKGILAYALEKYKDSIQLHHYVFLSNHFHLLLSAKSSQDLAEFMCFFKGNLARELARIHNWHGTFWQKRYSSEEVLDEGGLIDIFKYITQNSVKEGLVAHPKHWTGLHGYHQLVKGKTVSGPWFDRTAYYHSNQRREGKTEADFTSVHEVKLSPPPFWSHLSKINYKELCIKLCNEAVTEALSNRKVKSSLGMRKVREMQVKKARMTLKSPRPLCRTQCIKTLKNYQMLYLEFKTKFQKVSTDLRQAIRLGLETAPSCFPLGGVPLFGGRYSFD